MDGMDKNKTFLIVGLGLLGGKYAQVLSQKGYRVTGITHSQSTLDYALEHAYICEGRNENFDDLVQNGMLGLLDAIDRYQEGFGAQFETYATQRVRGAMLDGLRENDWLPRNLRRELRRIEAAINQLEHAHGRAPSERELAEALGMSLKNYQQLERGTNFETGKPVTIDTRTALACAALRAGLQPEG